MPEFEDAPALGGFGEGAEGGAGGADEIGVQAPDAAGDEGAHGAGAGVHAHGPEAVFAHDGSEGEHAAAEGAERAFASAAAEKHGRGGIGGPVDSGPGPILNGLKFGTDEPDSALAVLIRQAASRAAQRAAIPLQGCQVPHEGIRPIQRVTQFHSATAFRIAFPGIIVTFQEPDVKNFSVAILLPWVYNMYVTKKEVYCIMAYVISDECIACGACAAECPVGAISEGDGKYVIDPDVCVSCGACAGTCPVGAPQEG